MFCGMTTTTVLGVVTALNATRAKGGTVLELCRVMYCPKPERWVDF